MLSKKKLMQIMSDYSSYTHDVLADAIIKEYDKYRTLKAAIAANREKWQVCIAAYSNEQKRLDNELASLTAACDHPSLERSHTKTEHCVVCGKGFDATVS